MSTDQFQKNLSNYLFETTAVRVSPYDRPFFYTTGKIGPFYINTHYLYGAEKDAQDLLKFMNENLVENKKFELPVQLAKIIEKQYNEKSKFKVVIDRIVSDIMLKYNLNDVDYISGGERRDWFFSIIVATLLNKKHIAIYKDGSTYVTHNRVKVGEGIDFKGKNIIHICDLVTEASSFKNVWYPVIKESGNNMIASYAIIDRLQGGKEYFESIDVPFHSLIEVDIQLFLNGLNDKYIDINQYMLVDSYMKDPEGSMRELLLANIDFLKNSKKIDERTNKRVEKLLGENYYNLPDEFIKSV